MQSIEKEIYKKTRSELWHLENPGEKSRVYHKMQTEIKQGKECYRFDFPDTLNRYTVGVLKESRFTEIPFHFHTDMEMNYIYSGSCTFIMNEQEVTLKQGDICIMDADVIHNASYKKEEDIVFNIVFTKDFFRAKFVNWIGKQGLLGTFIASAVTESRQHDKYLIFHTDKIEQNQLLSEQLKTVLGLLIQEYYSPSFYKGDLMEQYLSAIFLLLINLISTDADFCESKENQTIFKVLDYLEKNYNKETCRLQHIAEELHFSQSHLYQLIKIGTGLSFSQLKTKKQMQQAALLLQTTSEPILGIAEEIGCKNRTYFYDKFKLAYKVTPAEYRDKKQFLKNS